MHIDSFQMYWGECWPDTWKKVERNIRHFRLFCKWVLSKSLVFYGIILPHITLEFFQRPLTEQEESWDVPRCVFVAPSCWLIFSLVGALLWKSRWNFRWLRLVEIRSTKPRKTERICCSREKKNKTLTKKWKTLNYIPQKRRLSWILQKKIQGFHLNVKLPWN